MRKIIMLFVLLALPFAYAQQTGVLEIGNYTVEEEDGYSWLEIPDYSMKEDMFSLYEPYISQKFTFPADQIVENITLISYSDPVELELNMPEVDYDDNDKMIFSERECNKETRKPFISTFPPSYTTEGTMYAVRFYPLEMVSCSDGKFNLYKKMTFKVNFKQEGKAKIAEVKYSEPIAPGTKVRLNISFTGTPEGTLKLLDIGGDVVDEKEITGDSYLEFTAEKSNGIYKVMYYEGNSLASYRELLMSINWATLDARILKTDSSTRKSVAVFINSFNDIKTDAELTISIVYLSNLSEKIVVNESLDVMPGEQIVYKEFNITKEEDLEDIKVVLSGNDVSIERVVPGFIKLDRNAIKGMQAPPTPAEIIDKELSKYGPSDKKKEEMSLTSKIALAASILAVLGIIIGAVIAFRK